MTEVHPLEPHPPTGTESIGRKRQRRPSVRLGDIGGDQGVLLCHSAGAGAHSRRNKQNLSDSDSKKDGIFKTSSRSQALANLATGSWNVRDTNRRVAARRARSNWGRDEEEEEEEQEDGFIVEDSASPLEERNVNGGLDGVEFSGPSDNDARGYGNDNAGCSGRGGGEDAVRVWLNSIGLGRYAPVFEVHEVDDEVLAMLTLEDLKDMGISAVGSRRKMFCAIQKLGRGFS